MKWVGGQCRLSADLIACVYPVVRVKWGAAIDSDDFGGIVDLGVHATEAAAKSAVAAWIGKTIAQLGNAVAAGETYPDDGA